MVFRLLAVLGAGLCLCACARGHTEDVPAVATIIGRAAGALRQAVVPPSKRVDHLTIVIMENRSFENIIGNQQAPYINKLAQGNMLFTKSYAVAHPSEPNYVALYSGSTQGLKSDACPVNYNARSLGGEAIVAHKSIKGYMEDIPAVGSTACEAGEYVRKHNPLIDFADTPATSSVPYSQLAGDLSSNRYPTIALVVPNVLHDMHDGTIAMGDAWLASNLPSILAFDATHKGLLILTWDEDHHDADNHIVTIAIGPTARAGQSDQPINHYSVLSTVTDLFGLQPLDNASPVSELTR
jgi:phosphatidylinositol-3-phosphatase